MTESWTVSKHHFASTDASTDPHKIYYNYKTSGPAFIFESSLLDPNPFELISWSLFSRNSKLDNQSLQGFHQGLR